MPSFGHCAAAAINASWTASSDAEKSRNRRTTAPRVCGARSRSRRSTSGTGIGAVTSDVVPAAHDLTHLDPELVDQRSIAPLNRQTGSGRSFGRELHRARLIFDVDDPIP